MCDSPLFGEFGLGIHNLPGPIFPYFDLYKDDPIDNLAVDPGLTASPYSSSPNSSFPSPEQLSGSSPLSCHEYFAGPRDSIGSLDEATIAPHETVTNNHTVAKHSGHNHNNNTNNNTDNNTDNNNNNNNNARSNNSKPSKAIPSSALASTSSSTTTTPAAAPQPPANTSPIVTRTRKASSQNTDASGSTAQPRAKKQKTTITVKLEPQEPQQQRPPQQRQRQSSPPKRKPARRGSTAKKEDVAQRTKNLERNRIAASKCRQKKKEWVVELEDTKNTLEARHAELRIEYFKLLGEVTGIKNELMAHAKCQDPNINFWIEKEALKYVERCMDPLERRPSMVGNAASGSSTLPSPAESHRSQQEQSLPRPEGGINLDYMPDELLTGDLV
ncbi:bZIP transcription factor [Trichoderma gamsii]|uniref:BZIP transcription factor n=1 Tax=Trichoderma gamsii TaxID=398673 RepID=A0A2P4ZJZ5_9HYPO|nr:bZIP transcription factor [Trichoderma gamsii]PON24585.1 bZIP transcription factor [Trichoderma gamsii]